MRVLRIKPSKSKGTRDFLPAEVAKRNYLFDTIKSVLRKYGFEEIETPAIEKLETLTGKYGEEGDKLLFKILNSGNPFKDVAYDDAQLIPKLTLIGFMGRYSPDDMKDDVMMKDAMQFDSELLKRIIPKISEKGLRYDLTVPLARYVVQHQDELAFPFKRFHIGPVWRADRPQKGRYQEFYQCDADVIGSDSLLNEIELLKIYLESFRNLGFNDGSADKIVVVKVNNRKILNGILEYLGIVEKSKEFTTIIDKYDKIGHSEMINEFKELGLSDSQVNEFNQIISANRQDTDGSFYDYFKALFNNREIKIGLQGIEDMHFVMSKFDSRGLDSVRFDVLLARGLDYYTGLITEINLDGSKIGSLGGGGRYDNLTEMFGGQNMSGVGISFGIERIYDVMEELGLFQKLIDEGKLVRGVKVLFVPRDENAQEFAFQQAQRLRDEGIPAEIFLGKPKKEKYFKYVEQKNIPYLVEVGTNEIDSKRLSLRNTKTFETENDLSLSDIIKKLK